MDLKKRILPIMFLLAGCISAPLIVDRELTRPPRTLKEWTRANNEQRAAITGPVCRRLFGDDSTARLKCSRALVRWLDSNAIDNPNAALGPFVEFFERNYNGDN